MTATNWFLVVVVVAAVAAVAVVAVEGADYLLTMALVVTLIEYVALDSVVVAASTVFKTN